MKEIYCQEELKVLKIVFLACNELPLGGFFELIDIVK